MENVTSLLLESLKYDFVVKALLVGSLIAISSSLLGVFLVLKKYSMIGDGLAHVSFATVALALFLNASPLFVSIPIVILASLLILKLNETAQMHGDAAIGLVSSFSVAFGVIMSSISNGFNVDLFSYLFGSILSIGDMDVWMSVVLSSIVILSVFIFYNDFFALSHDAEFADVIGIKTNVMNYVIAILTSITIVLGIRVVGTMLISSMIVFPTVSALQVSKSFKQTMIISTAVSITSVVTGVLFSYVLDLPTGAFIVMMNAVFFIVLFAVRKLK